MAMPAAIRFCHSARLTLIACIATLIAAGEGAQSNFSRNVTRYSSRSRALDNHRSCEEELRQVPRYRTYHGMPIPLSVKEFIQDVVATKLPTLVFQARIQLTMELAYAVIANDIEGDIVETGTYEGGSAISILKIMEEYDPQHKKKFWACDSFQGLPEPDVEKDVELDNESMKGERGLYSATEETMLENLKLFDVYDEQRVKIVKGFFNETLPSAPINSIALLRLDGDLYHSTHDVLQELYDKVSLGGVVYVDDYNTFAGCKRAVDEFRSARKIKEPLMVQPNADWGFDYKTKDNRWDAVYWVKARCNQRETKAWQQRQSAGLD